MVGESTGIYACFGVGIVVANPRLLLILLEYTKDMLVNVGDQLAGSTQDSKISMAGSTQDCWLLQCGAPKRDGTMVYKPHEY